MSNELTTPTAEAPPSLFDRINVVLPVALTAIATAFASMSNTQLQEAMFWRSSAAQDQAKATNQWTLAGFKRDRSLICQTTAAQLRATIRDQTNPFANMNATDSPAIAWLAGQGPETPTLPEITDADLKQLLADIQARKPEAELLVQAKKVKLKTITAMLDETEQALDRIDKEHDPILKSANALVAKMPAENATAAQAALFDLEQRRYRMEATLNQGVGFRYEARVKLSSSHSEKHQRKSLHFFYVMLAAQIGATISSLALARKKQSVLWAVAGFTGLVALSLGAYVYLSD